MKAYIIINIARQEFGEYVFVTTEKAFAERPRAEEYLKSRSANWKESVQGISCVCERGLHEIEIE